MENVTRIADLPMDNNRQMSNPQGTQLGTQQGMQQGTQQKRVSFEDGEAQNYMPINIHPNPYGVSAQNPIMTPPQQPAISQKQQIMAQTYMPPPPQSQFLSEEQQAELHQLSHQRIPSRDIPRDSMGYQHDEQVKPNFIPKSNTSSDYVRDHEDMTEKNRIEYENKKKEKNRFDNFMNEFQTPIFVAILFFLFQLPIINKLIFKRFDFLSLHDADGNFNLYGLIFKSSLFGGIYYTVFKAIHFLVEL
jgi:hypothetical protein